MLLMATGSTPRFVVAEGLSEPALDRLRAAGEVVRLDRHDEASLVAAVADADALIVRTYALVNARVIAAAKAGGRLRVIGRGGVGVDNIDVQAASEAGLIVVNTPAASTYSVADLAVGLIVALQRGIVYHDPKIRRGEFAALRAGAPKNSELRYQTLGIIGMGRIGRVVGFRMHTAMGMGVCYHDIRDAGWLPFVARRCESAAEVYAQSDVVTLHVPLTPLTRGMINERTLAAFKPGAYLLNTSRGPVLEAKAVADALREGRLAGAAVDVFDPEPPPPDHPLLGAPNCILTPHVGARTRESLAAMNDVVDDVIGIVAGKPPLYPVTPDDQ